MEDRFIPLFDRFDDETVAFSRIGDGEIGGKAAGLLLARDVIDALSRDCGPNVSLLIPRSIIVCTDVFDELVALNELSALIADREADDETIALGFQRAMLPPDRAGDLRALVRRLDAPLAVRSSSLLEDSLGRPFAGVYGTKMLPNADPDPDRRFNKLVEALKLVWASTFFDVARKYRRSIGLTDEHEKMAVVIQEVVGRRHDERFYPHVSGVARSVNYYPFAPAVPDDGVASLALGLGKTIVDGGVAYTYSPAHPKAPPPHGSVRDLLDNTQTKFWAVNMGRPPAYDPIRETEFLEEHELSVAEADECIAALASTYDFESDRVTPGVYKRGPRVLDFAPLLWDDSIPLNTTIRRLLSACEKRMGCPVEIELAANIEESSGLLEVGFLQVRAMVVSSSEVRITDEALSDTGNFICSDRVLGNGEWDDVRDIVFVKRDSFEAARTVEIASEIARMNNALWESGERYLLIGFGRWGSSDPWLGIPVQWSDIAGARAIVEAGVEGMTPDFSQGSHFFHNISSFEVAYYLVRGGATQRIDWEWLESLPPVTETDLVRHVRPAGPLGIRVDGRTGRGVVLR